MKVFRYNGKYKIAFKYYLNKQLKPDHTGAYPVYVLIRSKQNNTKVKSIINKNLNHESEIKHFEPIINKEVDGFHKTICERWHDEKFSLRELSHTPKVFRQTDYSFLIEFFKTKYRLKLEIEQITEIMEAVKTARKKNKKAENPDSLPLQ